MATTVIRTGRVLYLAGYRQDGYRTGQQPVYREARVEEDGEGNLWYYPSASSSPDGPLTLPESLREKVEWTR